jgi:hypothetical protein
MTDRKPRKTRSDINRTVRLQTKAAELQADIRRHMIPKENFFPNMLGWIAQTQGIETAETIYTLFEIGSQDHAELLDDMIQHPRALGKIIKDVFEGKSE